MALQVLINGIDRTDYIDIRTIRVKDEVGSKINTASFSTSDEDGTWVPSTSDTVIIYDPDSTKIFGGIISKISESRSGIVPGTTDELLKYRVDCQDYTKVLQRKLIVETYENMTCKQIIQAMVNKYFPLQNFTLTNTDDGPTITQISFNYLSGDTMLDNLAKAAGYRWYVDYDKDIHFFLQEDLSSVMTVNDSSTNWTDLVITPDVTQLRNRVYVRGGIYYSDPYTQKIVADGQAEEFLLAYTPKYEDFTVTVSATSRSVGLDNIDEEDDYDFMLNREEKALKMGNSAWAQANTPIADTTVLTLVYNYEIPVLIVQEDTDSIESMQSIEGSSGVYEHVIIDENITSISAARERASAELADYANPITRGQFKTHDAAGIKSGDLITINLTRRGLNADYIIQTVSISVIDPDTLVYNINFSGRLYGLVDVLLALFKRDTQIVLGKDEVLDAFNGYTDALSGITTGTPQYTYSTSPFAWSNDAGTTTNKARWSLAEWD